MSKRNFMQMLEAQWAKGNFVCVGLDSEYEKIPHHLKEGLSSLAGNITEFNRLIVEATKDLVCAYKPNSAFYESHGTEGWRALENTIRGIHEIAPDVPVILDAKRADIGNTNNGYVKAAFEYLQADAITVHPYLGREALQPFLEQVNKGIIVLCRTSNKGAHEFQDLEVIAQTEDEKRWGIGIGDNFAPTPLKLYECVALRVAHDWNTNGNCALVVGATYPEELHNVRSIVGDMPILIPGIGPQGGDLEASVKAAKSHFIINSSRGIIFASKGEDFAQVARSETEKLSSLINQYR